VVIAHDFMETYGGAERVTEEMARAFPEAPVVAILGRRRVADRMGIGDRFSSVLPARARLLSGWQLVTALCPGIVDRVRLPAADVLLTSSYAFAHGFRTVNDAPQVCYCHSPLRFAWTMTDAYREEWASGRLTGLAFRAFARTMREADRRVAGRAAHYLTQSPFTAEQIRRFYGRDADIIGAPVNTELFSPGDAPPEDYFLLSGRLIEPYKRVGMTVEAFRQLGMRLVIAGDGPALAELSANAPSNVEFVGHVQDDVLVDLMRRCRAAIFPSRDDFGLTPVEVMACGRPMLASSAGGARYTVVPGRTGELFDAETPQELADAVRAFAPESYDASEIRAHALQWDRLRFRARLRAAVSAAADQGSNDAPRDSSTGGRLRTGPLNGAGRSTAPVIERGSVKPPNSRRLLPRAAAVVIAVLLLIAVAQSAPGRSALRAMGLTAHAARYTELAFARPSGPGASGPSTSGNLVLPFVLHNVEDAPRSYDWTIDASARGQATTVAHGQVHLTAGQRVGISPRVACVYSGHVRIEVRLANPAQSIGFWTACPTSRLPARTPSQGRSRR
jgi:glycosyltransferase involved in cell wall biosynthesis